MWQVWSSFFLLEAIAHWEPSVTKRLKLFSYIYIYISESYGGKLGCSRLSDLVGQEFQSQICHLEIWLDFLQQKHTYLSLLAWPPYRLLTLALIDGGAFVTGPLSAGSSLQPFLRAQCHHRELEEHLAGACFGCHSQGPPGGADLITREIQLVELKDDTSHLESSCHFLFLETMQ